jgi:hypothetical protein
VKQILASKQGMQKRIQLIYQGFRSDKSFRRLFFSILFLSFFFVYSIVIIFQSMLSETAVNYLKEKLSAKLAAILAQQGTYLTFLLLSQDI